MPITLNEIRLAAARPRRRVAASLNEAVGLGLKTAFLCHSHKDKPLVEGVVNLLNDNGWNVYVDWADASMPAAPNRQTAATIQRRIVQAQYFLFLATANSMSSRWCPWEIGYADGKKPIDSIIIVPTSDGITTHGSAYLELYRRVDWSMLRKLLVVEPGATSGRSLDML